ncbi:MAG: LSU ribosomal protein L31p @ LSU ribosomal protein L31p, zinc-independent, partial [uncultured Microvirga sp.]
AQERRGPPGLSLHQGGDDRRHRIHDPFDLRQGRRYPESRHRPQHPPGLDRGPAAAAGPRRPRLAVQLALRQHGLRQEV